MLGAHNVLGKVEVPLLHFIIRFKDTTTGGDVEGGTNQLLFNGHTIERR